MTTLIVDGRRLYFTRPGRAPDGPTLLLLHGAGGSHLDWPRAIQRLPGVNVLNLDLPGHGRSEGSGYEGIDEYARDVDSFARALDLRDVCVAGHSMGGAIAQTLALAHAGWLASLVLIGTAAALPVSPLLLGDWQDDPAQAIGLIMRYSWSGDAAESLRELAAASMIATDAAVLQRSFVACDGFDVRDRLGEILLPTLVISGSADRMTPAKNGRALAAGIPGARFLEIADAGHYLTLEQPQRIAAAIAAFIEENSGLQAHS